MDLFLREATERIGADDALAKIDALVDWTSFSPILKRGRRTCTRPQTKSPSTRKPPQSHNQSLKRFVSADNSADQDEWQNY
jgi:hypothetical protein